MEEKHTMQAPVRYMLGEIPEEKMTFAVVVARYQDHWVFCRHKDRNTWEWPGGHIEAGETPLQAAQRELQEDPLSEGSFQLQSDFGFYVSRLRKTPYPWGLLSSE